MVMEKGEHSGGQLDHVDDDHVTMRMTMLIVTKLMVTMLMMTMFMATYSMLRRTNLNFEKPFNLQAGAK